MSILSNPRRVIKENLPSDKQDLVEPLGGPYNDFSSEVYNAINKNLSVNDNLVAFYKDIDLKVNSSGNPILTTQFKNTLNVKIKTIIIGKAQNLTNPSVYPTAAPFISFIESNQVVIVNNVTGLQEDTNWRLTLLCWG